LRPNFKHDAQNGDRVGKLRGEKNKKEQKQKEKEGGSGGVAGKKPKNLTPTNGKKGVEPPQAKRWKRKPNPQRVTFEEKRGLRSLGKKITRFSI